MRACTVIFVLVSVSILAGVTAVPASDRSERVYEFYGLLVETLKNEETDAWALARFLQEHRSVAKGCLSVLEKKVR